MFTDFDGLVGRTIKEIRLNDDATVLQFACTDGNLTYQAEADCCSESWFNHLSAVKALIGYTVVEVIQREERKEDGTRQEEDKVYGWTLVSPLGYADLELRNSSNGYCCGWSRLCDDGVLGDYQVVTEDF